MAGDIRFVEDRVEVDGLLKANGPISAQGGLSNFSGEVKSLGNLSGYSFADRSVTGFVQSLSADKGIRYVWYCDQKAARLWSGGDLVKVGWSNEAAGQVTMELTNGTLKCDSVVLPSVGPVADVIRSLLDRVTKLETQLFRSRVGATIGQSVAQEGSGPPPNLRR